jgi:hypothetical protein
MTAPLTPVEKAQKEADSLVAANEDLRREIAEAEASLHQQVQVDSIQSNVDILKRDNDLLKAQLQAAKDAVKAQEKSATPQEQADATAAAEREAADQAAKDAQAAADAAEKKKEN